MNTYESHAKALIEIASVIEVNFEVNAQKAIEYLNSKGLEFNDYDCGFESALEGLVPEHEMTDYKRECKALSILEDYVIGFWDLKDVA